MIKEPGLFLSWIGAIAMLVVLWPLGLLAIGAIIVYLVNRSKKHRALNGPQAILADLCRQVGMPESAPLAHVEAETGIVVNPNERILAMRLDGVTKVYGFEDVRGWEARTGARGSRAIGYGLGGTLAAGSQNMAEGARVEQETGFFMTMRDIDHPLWRISMRDSMQRARWDEIMHQQIGESQHAAGASSA